MSTSTTNLHLTKPAANEHADIAVINANYDLIDEFAGTVVVDPDYVHTENNYTTTEKQKLAGLENYTLPTASSSTKGGVKVDNESISIDQSGTISAALSGLKEVNIDAVTLSDGQTLKYDATSGEWVNASGGSGHTILDDDGIALAQEDDLQIKGVYSADNSEDGVTEVNVYREMTKSEFNALSSDEKKGFIRVTDEPDIYADGNFQPVIYSTEEREIGVWTDGKPLYEKTLELLSIPSTSPISIDVSALNIDVMASAIGEVYAISNGVITETVVLPAYVSQSYYGAIRFLNNNVQILHTGLGDYSNGKIIIQYTKTTDVAGSGTWTPTLVAPSVGSVGSSLVTPIAINDIPFDFVTVVNANVYDNNDKRWYPLSSLTKTASDRIFISPYLNKDVNPVIFYASLYTGGNTYSNLGELNVTIQYTKSS